MYFAAAIVFWALWRRVFGGWLGVPRLATMVVGFVAAAAPFYFAHGLSPSLVAGGLAMLFWTLGHNYGRWTIVLRYPLIGWVYPAARRFWRNEWNVPPFIDGWTAAAELGLGAQFGGVLFLVSML